MRATKLIAWYLIEVARPALPHRRRPIGVRVRPLDYMTGPIPDDHVLDMSEPLPRYLLELSDGNLDLVDRSQCGIIVMYAGVALQALSLPPAQHCAGRPRVGMLLGLGRRRRRDAHQGASPVARLRAAVPNAVL